MQKTYDETIAKHYENVAREHGLSSASTMLDEFTRARETAAITQFVAEVLRRREAAGMTEAATIMDVGCGNGYTLESLTKQFPNQLYVGIEQSVELRALASTRFVTTENVSILDGDIRDRDFAKGVKADILICQRVIINVLALEDQRIALTNIVNNVADPSASHSGGDLLFIECFQSVLENLNEAREEFDLPEIPPAHHNLYLPDDFFDIEGLESFADDGGLMPANFLSTHYFVSRVLNPGVTPAGKPFKRNSEFSKFFTAALQDNVGDYSPLKLRRFTKVS